MCLPRKALSSSVLMLAILIGRVAVIRAEGGVNGEGAALDHVPNEIIVKFSKRVTDKLGLGVPEAAAGNVQLSDSLDRLQQSYRVQSIEPVFPGFRAHRNRVQALAGRRVIASNETERRLLRRLRRAPAGAVVPDLDRIFTFRLDLQEGQSLEDAVAAYSRDPDVAYAELNHVYAPCAVPNDSVFPYQWSLDKIDASQAWDLHTGDPETVVAVIDWGVDYDHRDLRGNMWVNDAEANGETGVDDDENGYVDDVYGYDFSGGQGDPIDTTGNGHGTHCAGIAAAQGNNLLLITGVCWDARVMALKFDGTETDAATAMYYAVANGADVTSNSYGGRNPEATVEQAIQYAHSQGVVMVAAAGNESSSSLFYPAAYDHMIAVASTDTNDEKASHSNYGSWVDIAAPGVGIYSLYPGGGLFNLSGTSMACPHVAGAAALLLSLHPTLTPDEVRDVLMDTADPIAPGICASGRLNLASAMAAAAPARGYIRLDADAYACTDAPAQPADPPHLVYRPRAVAGPDRGSATGSVRPVVDVGWAGGQRQDAHRVGGGGTDARLLRARCLLCVFGFPTVGEGHRTDHRPGARSVLSWRRRSESTTAKLSAWEVRAAGVGQFRTSGRGSDNSD